MQLQPACSVPDACGRLIRPVSAPAAPARPLLGCSGSSRRRPTLTAAAAAGTSAPSAAKVAAPGPPMELVRLPPEVLADGGLDPSRQSAADVDAFERMLRTAFLPVNMRFPGLRVQNIDPPVITCDNFLPPEVCDALLAAAKGSGRMKGSQVGGTGDGAPADIRTSSTLAITRDVLAAVPALQQPLQHLLDTALMLLGQQQQEGGTGPQQQQQQQQQLLPQQQLGPSGGGQLLDTSAISGMQFVRPSSVTQLCPELPQVAHYLPGQHFLSHEDGFPGPVALEKGYNRRATLLVYLNDVPQGGATRFDHLDLAVQPQRGKALLFFPAFSGGKSDARTLHTAEDAAEGCEKWVFQLWLCTGLPRRPPIDAAAAAVQQLAAQRRAAGGGGSSGGSGKKKRPGAAKRKR